MIIEKKSEIQVSKGHLDHEESKKEDFVSEKKVMTDIERALKEKSIEKGEIVQEKDHLSLTFLGNVDSGKSTICGGLFFWTGAFQLNETTKLPIGAREEARESWDFGHIWNTYRWEDYVGYNEKYITELLYRRFELQTKRLTIIEGPRRKSSTLKRKIAQADVACLVVSAKAGEFECGIYFIFISSVVSIYHRIRQRGLNKRPCDVGKVSWGFSIDSNCQ